MENNYSEKELLHKLIEEICIKRDYRPTYSETLSRALRKRFKRAYDAVKKGLVKKYVFTPSGKIVWIVTGKEQDYQIIPLADFCTCDDFYFRVINHEVALCYHVIAQKIAEFLVEYKEIEKPDEFYERQMMKWRKVKMKKRRLPIVEIKNIRETVETILSKNEDLAIHQLLKNLKNVGFDVLTTHHLASILSTDRTKRFVCKDRKWRLANKLVLIFI
ncbi:hypothetical protein KAX03_01755 [Candidatus Bathyarchaeota archaeon]|nr:hypothetical protein [Candidatus Bathyarchaeota archaeon]